MISSPLLNLRSFIVLHFQSLFFTLVLSLFRVYWQTNRLAQSPFREADSSPLVQKFPLFCGIWRFITVFTRAHHSSLFWSRRIQSATSHPFPLTCILISNRLLGLPGGLFYSRLPMKILYIFLFFPITTHVPFRDLITVKLLVNCACAVGLRNHR